MNEQKENISLKKTIFNISIIITLLSIFSEYFFQIFASLIVLNIFVYWFGYKDKPLIILFGYGFSWLSITVGYFYAWIFNSTPEVLLSRPFYSRDNLDTAFWLSLIGILITALGTKLIISTTEKNKLDYNKVRNYDPLSLIIIYIFYTFIFTSLRTFSRVTFPGLFQLFVFLTFLKWGIFFVMFSTVFIQNKRKNLFFIVLASEFLLGFTSYFSQFKEIIFFTIISYFSLMALNKKMIIPSILLGIFVFIVGVFWSYVKPDYREFLSGGQRAQIVTVSKTEALKKIFSYIPEFNMAKFKVGRDVLFSRLFFLEFFSATIRYVPKYQPYFNGENWYAAIKHIMMPRFLFPNKAVIDDSEQTYKLTGIYVARRSQGASISVGYTAEAYADFGKFWMFIPLFLLGIIWGFIYKLIINTPINNIWGYAAIFPMYYQFSAYGKNIIKLLGDTFWFLIAAFVFIKFLVPLFEKFIKNE